MLVHSQVGALIYLSSCSSVGAKPTKNTPHLLPLGRLNPKGIGYSSK
ncbi:hypothetical protein MXB_5182 [Myxobolus squamalis]|nr:hypothetical protein MXB_5182 [Myxobolus squamalis]